MTAVALVRPSPALSRADAQVAARAAICASLLGAAAIHGTVVSYHWAEWRLAGAFFIGTQVVEISLALAAVYAWRRRAAQLVFVTSVGTVAVWLLSRSVGMPFGPAVFRVPEAIGVPDLACCALELGAAALAAPMAFTPRVRASVSGAVSRTGLALSACLVVAALAVSGWGLSPALSVRGPGAAVHQHGGH